MEIKMSALQIHTVTLLMKVTYKHLIPWGTVNLVSLESKINKLLPSTSSLETYRFNGNKFHCSPKDQSLSYLLYRKTKKEKTCWDSSDNTSPSSTACSDHMQQQSTYPG